MTALRVKWALLLPLTGVVLGCHTASPPEPSTIPQADKGDALNVDTNTAKATSLLPVLPARFLERLRLRTREINSIPPNFRKVDGKPAIQTSVGPFMLMDETSIVNRKWRATAASSSLLDVASPFSSYVNSNAYLNSINPKSLGVPLPPTPVFHNVNLIVRDQGPGRETCVAHASLAGMAMQPNVPDNLSQQYAHHWFMRHLTPASTCCSNDGVFVIDAGNELKNIGIPTADPGTEREYTMEDPACSDNFNCNVAHHNDVMSIVSPTYWIKDIDEIPNGNTFASIGNVGYLEAIIAAGYDIVYLFEVNFWDPDNPDGHDAEGIIRVVRIGGQPMHSAAYHAVLLTGYDRDRQYFVARNSFGPGWGRWQGDAHLSYDYVSTYSIAGYIIKGVIRR